MLLDWKHDRLEVVLRFQIHSLHSLEMLLDWKHQRGVRQPQERRGGSPLAGDVIRLETSLPL